MNRRTAENKKFKALYAVSLALMVLCVIAVFGTIGAATMSDTMSTTSLAIRCILFSIAGLLSWVASRGFKHRIWRLVNEELKRISSDVAEHLRRDGCPAVEDLSA